MVGEPILVTLVEDNIDHAELVIRTLEEHHIANTVRHSLDGQFALDYLFCRGELLSSDLEFYWLGWNVNPNFKR